MKHGKLKDHPFYETAEILRDLAKDLRRWISNGGKMPAVASLDDLRKLSAINFVASDIDRTMQLSDTASEAWFVYGYLHRAANSFENMARIDISNGWTPNEEE